MNVFQYVSGLVKFQELDASRTYLAAVSAQGPEIMEVAGLSFILPTRDSFELLSNCVDSLTQNLQKAKINFELIIIDNKTSERRALRYLRGIKLRENVNIIQYNKPFNYAAMINIGVETAKYPTVVVINNDLEFPQTGVFEPLIRHILNPHIGVVAPVLHNPDGTTQSSGISLGHKGVAGHITQPLDQCAQVSAVSFAIAMFRKTDFLRLGGLSERYKVGLNDVDFCIRIDKQGLRIAICAESSVLHVGSASRGSSFGLRRIFRATVEVLRFLKQYPNLVDLYHKPSK